jgi:hypothetical protein
MRITIAQWWKLHILARVPLILMTNASHVNCDFVCLEPKPASNDPVRERFLRATLSFLLSFKE